MVRGGRPWTKAEALVALRRWAAENGREPRYNDWQPVPPGMPNRRTLDRLFGGWRAAMASAGFSAPGPGEQNKPHLIDRTVPCANARCGDPIGARGWDSRCYRCARYLRQHGVERPRGKGIVDGLPREEPVEVVRRREELGVAWRAGVPSRLIAERLGYASAEVVLVRVVELRRRFPDRFPLRHAVSAEGRRRMAGRR